MGRLQRKKKATKIKKRKTIGDSTVSDVQSKSQMLSKPKEKKHSRLSVGSDANASNSAFAVRVGRIVSFFKESKLEIERVVWPSKKQAIGSSFLVMAIASVISIFLGIIDIGLSNMVRAILR